MNTHRTTIASLALAATLGLGACGATHASPTTARVNPGGVMRPAPTTTAAPVVKVTDYKSQYLGDVAKSNTETLAIKNAPGNPTQSQLNTLAADYTAMSRKMLGQTWPSNAAADVHSFALAELQAATLLSTPAPVGGVLAAVPELTQGDADAVAIRADLGLPAA